MLKAKDILLLYISLIILILATSCRQNKVNLLSEPGENLVGLASVIQLNPEGRNVPIADYFVHPELIDSIRYPTGNVKISDDSKSFSFFGNSLQPMGILEVFSGDTTFSLLVKQSDKQKTSFKVEDPDREY